MARKNHENRTDLYGKAVSNLLYHGTGTKLKVGDIVIPRDSLLTKKGGAGGFGGVAYATPQLDTALFMARDAVDYGVNQGKKVRAYSVQPLDEDDTLESRDMGMNIPNRVEGTDHLSVPAVEVRSSKGFKVVGKVKLSKDSIKYIGFDHKY